MRIIKRNKTCPICHENDEVIPIEYGYPSQKLIEDSVKGKARIGGCLISVWDPNWYCKRCEDEKHGN